MLCLIREYHGMKLFRGASDNINKNELLAEFFEIDLKEAEREKEDVLKAI